MSKNRTTLLVDSDQLVYNGGFSADKQATDKWGDEASEVDYSHWCYHNINTYFETLLEAFPSATTVRPFIGGIGNYRDSIARIQPYKGNRDKNHRPKFYEEMRRYLVERYGATLSHGREADDEVSILQFQDKGVSTVIISFDKDLKNTPGWNYNPVKKELTYITKTEADISFWSQVLTGDSTDNIRGIKGLGPKTRDKIVNACNRDVKALKKEVDNQYKKAYGKDWEGALWENASLLWIQRKDWVNWDGSKIDKPTTSVGKNDDETAPAR